MAEDDTASDPILIILSGMVAVALLFGAFMGMGATVAAYEFGEQWMLEPLLATILVPLLIVALYFYRVDVQRWADAE